MGRAIKQVTRDLLNNLLRYDAMTGNFHWIVNRQGHTKAGDLAGSKARNGYIGIMVCGKRYGAHRLAWMCMYGTWPVNQIDHINGVRDDNRFFNLRDVSSALNKQNQRRAHKGSRTGILGVSPNGRGFKASITVAGVTRTLGTYQKIQDAQAAYIAGKRVMHVAGTL